VHFKEDLSSSNSFNQRVEQKPSPLLGEMQESKRSSLQNESFNKKMSQMPYNYAGLKSADNSITVDRSTA